MAAAAAAANFLGMAQHNYIALSAAQRATAVAAQVSQITSDLTNRLTTHTYAIAGLASLTVALGVAGAAVSNYLLSQTNSLANRLTSVESAQKTIPQKITDSVNEAFAGKFGVCKADLAKCKVDNEALLEHANNTLANSGDLEAAYDACTAALELCEKQKA